MLEGTEPTLDDGLTRSSAFIALSMAAFLSGANLRLFDALLPAVAIDFGVLPTTAAVVITAFTFSYGLFQIVHGPLGDRLGKLRIAALATIFSSITSLGCAFAPTLQILTLLRFLTGAGISAVVPLSLAWLGDKSSYAMRQAILGRFVGFLLLGQVLGPAFGGILSQFFSWREVFYGLAAAFFLVGVVLVLEAGKKENKTDIAKRRNVFIEYIELLKDSWVRKVLIVIFIEGVLFFGTYSFVGAYLQHTFNLSFGITGVLLACYGIGGFLYTLFVRRLLKKLNEAGFVKLAGGMILVSFFILAFLPAWYLAIPVLTLVGFGLYMLHNTLQTKATEMAPGARGTALALFAFCLFIGQSFGVSGVGALIRLIGYSWTFIVSGILLMLLARLFAYYIQKQ